MAGATVFNISLWQGIRKGFGSLHVQGTSHRQAGLDQERTHGTRQAFLMDGALKDMNKDY